MEKKQISEKLKNMLINSVTSFHNFETENNCTSQNLDELTTDELKNKIKTLESKNKQIDEELFSIKNKYYVQAKILNDKNAELSKEVSERQRLTVEMEKISNCKYCIFLYSSRFLVINSSSSIKPISESIELESLYVACVPS